MTNALAAADELLTPIQCEYFALEGLVKIVRLIEQVRDSGANKRLELGGIVMTMFDARTNLSEQVVAEVRKHFGERMRLGPGFGRPVLSRKADHNHCRFIGRRRFRHLWPPLIAPHAQAYPRQSRHDRHQYDRRGQ